MLQRNSMSVTSYDKMNIAGIKIKNKPDEYV